MEKIIQKLIVNPKKSILAACIALTLLLIRHQHKKLIYIPVAGLGKSPSTNPFPYRNPNEQNLTYENITINSKDGEQLKGWYIKCNENKPSERIVLYFHQNAGNIGTRLPYIKQIIKKTYSDVVIVGYRGYSDSSGSPSEKGLKLDAQAILEWTIKKSQQVRLPIVLLGRSLGGATALHACIKYQDRIKGIILENTFTSIKDVAIDLVPLIFRPLAHILLFLTLTNRWKSINLIKDVRIPVLFVKSVKDELIPIKQMNELSDRCESRHYEYVIEDGTHNETWILNTEEYFQQFGLFFSRL